RWSGHPHADLDDLDAFHRSGHGRQPTTRSRVCPDRQRVAGRDRGEHLGARLAGPRLGVVVDVDDAEPLAVPEAPLEVVEQRPGEISTNVDAVGDRIEYRAEVRL